MLMVPLITMSYWLAWHNLADGRSPATSLASSRVGSATDALSAGQALEYVRGRAEIMTRLLQYPIDISPVSTVAEDTQWVAMRWAYWPDSACGTYDLAPREGSSLQPGSSATARRWTLPATCTRQPIAATNSVATRASCSALGAAWALFRRRELWSVLPLPMVWVAAYTVILASIATRSPFGPTRWSLG